MIPSFCRCLQYYLTVKNSASPANSSSWPDCWIVFSRMISGELSTSEAFAIILGAKSAWRVPHNASLFCLQPCPSLFLLSCGKGVREERRSARGSSRAAQWEELRVGRSFCRSKAAANVVGVQRRRPLTLHCMSHKCNLEIGFTLCSFFPLRLIGYRTHERPCAVMVEALWCPRELSQWQNIQ